MSYYTDLDDFLGQCEQAEMDEVLEALDNEDIDLDLEDFTEDPKRELQRMFNSSNLRNDKIVLTEIDYIWTMRDGTKIRVKDMKTSHLKRSLAMCERNNTHPETIDALKSELKSRNIEKENVKRTVRDCKASNKFGKLSGNQNMICHCGKPYVARAADLKRGWALSCSKSCAAIKRDYGRPDAKLAK